MVEFQAAHRPGGGVSEFGPVTGLLTMYCPAALRSHSIWPEAGHSLSPVAVIHVTSHILGIFENNRFTFQNRLSNHIYTDQTVWRTALDWLTDGNLPRVSWCLSSADFTANRWFVTQISRGSVDRRWRSKNTCEARSCRRQPGISRRIMKLYRQWHAIASSVSVVATGKGHKASCGGSHHSTIGQSCTWWHDDQQWQVLGHDITHDEWVARQSQMCNSSSDHSP